MQEDYLAKWLNNELSDAALLEFKKSDAYATYKKIKDTSAKLEAPIFDADTAWEELNNKRNQKETKVVTLSPFKGFLRVAAVIAVLLTGAYFYLNTQNKTFTTQFAEHTEIILPDSSEVSLNAESKISFNDKNWDNQRNISLKGEAHFKVAKGNTFTVTTDQGKITVLGTQFNVVQRSDFFKVTCYEGLVGVTYGDKKYKLLAGSSISVLNGKLSKSTAVINGVPSWLQGESSFESIPLKYVLAEFQRQHNLTVVSEGVNSDLLFTGSFSNTDTDLALKSISIPLQLKFTLKGNNVQFYEENTAK